MPKAKKIDVVKDYGNVRIIRVGDRGKYRVEEKGRIKKSEFSSIAEFEPDFNIENERAYPLWLRQKIDTSNNTKRSTSKTARANLPKRKTTSDSAKKSTKKK